MGYLILAYSTSMQCTLVGTAKGRPFATENSAQRAAERLVETRSSVRALVLPIEALEPS